MGRLEKFRECRRVKRKIAFAVLLFLSLVSVGICVTDYSVNSILHNRRQLGIITFNDEDARYFRLNFMNWEIKIDVRFIENDAKKLKDMLVRYFK